MSFTTKMKLLTFLLAYSSLWGQCLAAEHSLDGYAFDCGGLLIGFEGGDRIHCMNGADVPCGDYSYDGGKLLSGYSTLTGPFTAWNIDKVDGIVISFSSDLGVACNAVSLDWRKYSTSRFLGLKCPIQNEVPKVSFQDNHFSLGVSGDVALRSPLKLLASGRRLVRDMYGVYRWFDDETIRFYLGPQQSQPLLVLDGRLSANGDLYVEGFQPPGPCTHDGSSALFNATQLPRTSLPVQQQEPPRATPTPTTSSAISTQISFCGMFLSLGGLVFLAMGLAI